jgi:hypothetical protein
MKRAQIETAKEILANVLHVRPSVVEDMIQRKLEERSQAVEAGASLRGRAMACHVLPGWIDMGRSFESVRMWREGRIRPLDQGSWAMKEGVSSLRSEMTKEHSSEAFYALDDQLGAALFSVLVELIKEFDKSDEDKESIPQIFKSDLHMQPNAPSGNCIPISVTQQ